MVDRRGRILVVAVALASVGCVRGCTSSRPPIHVNPSMDNQPKLLPQAASGFFYDGSGMRKPVAGTIARGELNEDTALHAGVDAAGQPVATSPVATDDVVLARGAERYQIYCQPCHDPRGDGKGIMFQRGKVPTPSLHSEKVLTGTDGYLFGVITSGSGLMPAYKWPIPPKDRWAIVAHVRALQAKRAAEGGTPVAAPAPVPIESPVVDASPQAPAGGTP